MGCPPGAAADGLTCVVAPVDVLDVEKEQEKAEGHHRCCGAAEQEGETALAVDHLREETTTVATSEAADLS